MNPHSKRHAFAEDEVVITGMGAICSLGGTVSEIRYALSSGKSGAGPITGFDAGGFGCLAAQVQDPPNIKTDIIPQLAKTMGKHLSLLLSSSEEALDHSGIRSYPPEPAEFGFFAGMGMVDYHIEDLLPAVLKSLGPDGELDYDKFFSGGYREIYPLWPLGMLNNVAFCQAAIHFGLRGENCVFSPHGDAGVQAVAEAVKVLREGKAKAVLAGGVSEEISPLSLARARLNGLLGPFAAEPGRKGTDRGASAFLGEGGAMMVLEPLLLAEQRGSLPLARISGYGFACEAGEGLNSPSSNAISLAMEQAIAHARMQPEEIDLVMLGSAGSSEELDAVGRLFSRGAKGPVLLSPARAFGEMFAAGPILSAIIAIKMFDLPLILPGLHVSMPDRRTGLADIIRKYRRALINAISYEGRCASFIIEKYSDQESG